jgi:hypothetical protein
MIVGEFFCLQFEKDKAIINAIKVGLISLRIGTGFEVGNWRIYISANSSIYLKIMLNDRGERKNS